MGDEKEKINLPGGNLSGPEGEPRGYKFRVRIENPQGIFEQLKVPTIQGMVSLGMTPLDFPLDHVSVTAISEGKKFDSLTQICFDSDLASEQRRNLPFEEKLVTEGFKTKKIGKSLIVLDEQGNPEFEIKSSSFSTIVILVGRGEAGGGMTSLKELTCPADFEIWLRKYASLIKTCVDAVYQGSSKESPDVELVLRPSRKQGTELAAVALGDLLAKFGDFGERLKGKILLEKPYVSFAEIGGQEGAKREIQGLAFALKNPQLYQKWGTRPPKGVLLYGPPGTGKTLMAKALASEADAQFLHVSVSDVTSKWVGESEKIMEEIFELASKAETRSIVFFDEVDAIAPERDYSSEVSRRILSVMLEKLDGIESNPNIMVVCSTNRLEAVDPALVRPGRIDRLVEVPLPDDKGRREIFGIHVAMANKQAGRKVFSELDMNALVSKTKGFSGADIAEIIRRTLEEKVREEGTTGTQPELVTVNDISEAIEGYERVKETKVKLGFRAS